MPETAAQTAIEKIQNAYVALCETKPYYKIKVSEVAAAAGVNRTTFYRHYLGMPDLILAMYHRYIRTFLSVPQGMRIETRADLEQFSNLVWERLTVHKAGLLRILNMPGVLTMMILCGRALQSKLRRLARKAGLTDPAIDRNISYTPYMFVVRLFITVKGEEILDEHLLTQQQLFDFSQSIPENLARYMEANLGGNSDFHYTLFGAYIKLTTISEEETITVTKLLDAAGISRTQFYLYYKNIDDFREKFYYTCFEMAIEIILYVLRRPDPIPEPEVSKLRDTIYDAYNQKAVRRILSSGKIVKYVSYIVAHIYMRYREQLERDYGKLSDAQMETLVYYVGVTCTLSLKYYMRRISYETYSEGIVDVKKIMKNALNIDSSQ